MKKPEKRPRWLINLDKGLAAWVMYGLNLVAKGAELTNVGDMLDWLGGEEEYYETPVTG